MIFLQSKNNLLRTLSLMTIYSIFRFFNFFFLKATVNVLLFFFPPSFLAGKQYLLSAHITILLHSPSQIYISLVFCYLTSYKHFIKNFIFPSLKVSSYFNKKSTVRSQLDLINPEFKNNLKYKHTEKKKKKHVGIIASGKAKRFSHFL